LTSAVRSTVRRPIAGMFRRTAESTVRACVRWGVHADAVSYASLLASAAAALCFWQSGRQPWLLIPAVGFCYLRLWMNMLDGMVAIASGTCSQRGELLNDLPDRISDVAIFVGVAHSGLCHPLGGYWVSIFALLVAYVGTFGQAVGAQRQFGGVMSKPWRMVALHVGSWLTLGLLWSHQPIVWADLTILDWTQLAIIAGCVQTVWLRLARILQGLERERVSRPGGS